MKMSLFLLLLSSIALFTTCSKGPQENHSFHSTLLKGEGTFIERCGNRSDSIQVRKNSLRFFQPKGKLKGTVKETRTLFKTSQVEDTVFFGDTAYFYGMVNGKSPRFFIGENVGRGMKKFVYMEVILLDSLAKDKPYKQVFSKGSNLILCEQGEPEIPKFFVQLILDGYDFEHLSISDLFKVKTARDRFMELEIDFMYLDDVSHVFDRVDLEAKLREKTKDKPLQVKHFVDLGKEGALRLIPLTRQQLEFMQLSPEQLLELGAKPKPDYVVPHFH